MKKLWNKYSYAITLIILSCSVAFTLTIKDHSQADENYLKVTVSEGDSLWELSNQYSEQHSLSNKQFVSWVKKHNKNISDQIFPGEEIVIPVSMEDPSTRELASAPGN